MDVVALFASVQEAESGASEFMASPGYTVRLS